VRCWRARPLADLGWRAVAAAFGDADFVINVRARRHRMDAMKIHALYAKSLGSLANLALCCAAALLVAACGGHASSAFFDAEDSGSGSGKTGQGGGLGNGSGNGGGGSMGSLGSGGSSDDAGTAATVQVIYANTDTELYSMDPTTHAVTDIGPFEVNGSPPSDAVTDLAVDAEGNVWVNTETDVYRAAVPTTPGPVALTLQTTTSSSSKFYALGFAPAGVLGSGEGLVAGDGNGELWYIDTSTSNATPQDLGGFGSDPKGDPWELSGDIVFYTQNGSPTGLATIRSCSSSGDDCSKSNDSLASINMTALSQAYSSGTPGTLLAGTYGSGTGVGELFGLGAWGNAAYGFAREQSSSPAQLVEIDGTTGAGASLQTFPSITSGWSGAGVTTKASISVPQPTQ
jgi:hypothetical protein